LARRLKGPVDPHDELVQAINRDSRVAPAMPLIVAEPARGVTTTLDGVLPGAIFTAPAPGV
jgi:hypothetical protein